MEFTTTLESAVISARNNELEAWIHHYLTTDGRNKDFSIGLKLAKREFFGPVELALGVIDRCCGPEEHMKYRVTQESFDERVREIKRAIEAQFHLPPLILNFSDNTLTINDGNHRYQALKELGFMRAHAIIWTTGAKDLTVFQERYGTFYREIK